MAEQVLNKGKIVELVEKIEDIRERKKALSDEEKKLIDEYTQFTGVPDKKVLKSAIAIARKQINKNDFSDVLNIVEQVITGD